MAWRGTPPNGRGLQRRGTLHSSYIPFSFTADFAAERRVAPVELTARARQDTQKLSSSTFVSLSLSFPSIKGEKKRRNCWLTFGTALCGRHVNSQHQKLSFLLSKHDLLVCCWVCGALVPSCSVFVIVCVCVCAVFFCVRPDRLTKNWLDIHLNRNNILKQNGNRVVSSGRLVDAGRIGICCRPGHEPTTDHLRPHSKRSRSLRGKWIQFDFF